MNTDSELIQQNVQDAWRRIEALLTRAGAGNEFRPPATDDALTTLENQIGAPLPLALRTHLKCHDGCVDFTDQIVIGDPFLSAEEIFNDWKTNCDVDEDSSKEVEGSDFDGFWWHQRMIPFAGSDGDSICVDSKTGSVYSHNHGMGGIGMGGVVAPSLESWLGTLADQLETEVENGTIKIEDGKAVLELIV